MVCKVRVVVYILHTPVHCNRLIACSVLYAVEGQSKTLQVYIRNVLLVSTLSTQGNKKTAHRTILMIYKCLVILTVLAVQSVVRTYLTLLLKT